MPRQVLLVWALLCSCACLRGAALPIQTSCSLLKRPHTTSSPLVFLHLPKVGGTSVREVLDKTSHRLSLSMCADLSLPHVLFDQNTFEPVHTCDILFGHLFFGIVEGYDQAKQPYYSVVLRDPVERELAVSSLAVQVLSLYYYVLKYPEHYQYQYFSNTTLHDLILASADRANGKAEYHPNVLAVNVMTWWLCGYDCNPRTMTLTSALVRAKRNLLEKIEVVGITENMPAFMEALRATVPILANISLPAARVNTNDSKRASTYASERTEEELDVLQTALYADRALYRLARELVQQQADCIVSGGLSRASL